jgi:hypothetical protein
MVEKDNVQNETANALIDMQRQNLIFANKAYINQLKYIIKRIEETAKKKNKDRLDYAHMINETINVMFSSVKGWQKWANIRTMHDVMTDKELEKYAPKMFELAKAWVQMDIDITTGKIKEDEKKLKGKKQPKKENYVS